MSITDNLTKATRTTLVQAQVLNKLHQPATLSLVEVTTPDNRQYSSTLGGSTNSSPFTCQDYYPRHQTNSLDMGKTPSTLDNLFVRKPTQSLGAYVLSRTHKTHVASNMALYGTCQSSKQSCYRSANARPLACLLYTSDAADE